MKTTKAFELTSVIPELFLFCEGTGQILGYWKVFIWTCMVKLLQS